jgi:hypothetical protein
LGIRKRIVFQKRPREIRLTEVDSGKIGFGQVNAW